MNARWFRDLGLLPLVWRHPLFGSACRSREERCRRRTAQATARCAGCVTGTMTGAGNGAIIWSPQAFTFVANSTWTTLKLSDVSATSNSLDLLLDDVRVSGNSPAFSLTVNSSPDDGASVAMSPPDRNGDSGGTTRFTRSFIAGSIVNLSAPSSLAGVNFLKWTRNGADYSSSTAINVTMDADLGLTAVYRANRPPIVANPIPDQNAGEDESFSYALPGNTFADVDDGDVLSYAATGLPAWLAFDPETRTFSGTPADADGGFTDIAVTATDTGTLEQRVFSVPTTDRDRMFMRHAVRSE